MNETYYESMHLLTSKQSRKSSNCILSEEPLSTGFKNDMLDESAQYYFLFTAGTNEKR